MNEVGILQSVLMENYQIIASDYHPVLSETLSVAAYILNLCVKAVDSGCNGKMFGIFWDQKPCFIYIALYLYF